jgi:phage shock protein C
MRKLYLSRNDSKIFGVCGGIGKTYDVDPTAVRIATVFLCLATGGIPLLVTYFVAWILMPKQAAQ